MEFIENFISDYDPQGVHNQFQFEFLDKDMMESRNRKGLTEILEDLSKKNDLLE